MTESKDVQVNESLLPIQGFLNLPKIKGYLDSILKERAGQFITSLVSLANLDNKLSKCKPRSLMMCGLKSASLNLPLDNNLGFAYAIPYGDEAQFQIGYKGFIQLAMRTGSYRSINVIEIREGELKVWDALTETLELQVIDDEKVREKTNILGYAAMFELQNGFRKVLYRKKTDLLAHGKRFSKTYTKGPWQSDTDAMCKKTLIKEILSKWGPLSTEILEGIKADQAIIRETDKGEVYEYIDTGAEIEQDTYDIEPELLEELNTLFDALGMNQAARDMKLNAIRGNKDAAEILKEELLEQAKKLKKKVLSPPASEKDNAPSAEELFGKKPKEETQQEAF